MTNKISEQEICARLAALTGRARNGTLDVSDLSDAVRCIYEDGGGPSKSLGYEWAAQRFKLFEQTLGDEATAGRFMWEHLDVYQFARLAILRADFLMLLPEDQRRTYVSAVIDRYGAWNTHWVRAALDAGIPRHEIGEIIIDRLDKTTEDELKHANFLRDFIEYGEGDGFFRQSQTPWGVLDSEQFARALRICTAKSPGQVFAKHRHLAAHLQADVLREILVAAADQLDHVSDLDAVRSLPVEAQKALALRLKPVRGDAADTTVKFLAALSFDLAGQEPDFFEKASTALSDADPALVFAAILPTLERAKARMDPQYVARVEGVLRQRVTEAGYLEGRVERGMPFDWQRSAAAPGQVRVRKDDIIYVQHRDQSECQVLPGDRVFFAPRQGRVLSPVVTAVFFIKVPQAD